VITGQRPSSATGVGEAIKKHQALERGSLSSRVCNATTGCYEAEERVPTNSIVIYFGKEVFLDSLPPKSEWI
jgi:hypothetical protein